MNVTRLRVQHHPLLVELAIYLASVDPPAPAADERGDWRADVLAGPGDVDLARPNAYRRQLLPAPLPSWMPAGVTFGALVYYPAGGAGLGWHTDSISPGWRVYIGRPLGAMPGLFMWRGGACYDAPGVATAFHVSGRPASSWHAVRCEGPRLSIGLRIRDAAVARALGLQSSGT